MENFLDLLNINNRRDIKDICKGTISRQGLNKHFGITIKKHELSKYRDLYLTQCVEKLLSGEYDKRFLHQSLRLQTIRENTLFLKSLAYIKKNAATIRKNTLFLKSLAYIKENTTKEKLWEYMTKYAKKEPAFEIENKKIETLINLTIYCSSFGISWITYLLAFPSGNSIITNLFSKPTLTSLLNLYMFIYAVQLTGVYDKTVYMNSEFIKGIFEIIPFVDIPDAILKSLNLNYIMPHLNGTHSRFEGLSITVDHTLVFYIGQALVVILEFIYNKIKSLGGEEKLLKLIKSVNFTK